MLKPVLFFSLLLLGSFSHVRAEDVVYDFSAMEEVLDHSVSGGVDTNNFSSCSVANKSRKKADELFYRAAWKLSNVNGWADLMNIPGQDFQLFKGKKSLDRTAEEGDLIRILLPMDPTRRSYWVKIESIKKLYKKDSKTLTIVVRPTVNPFKNRKGTSITDHFFTNQATNTFSVTLTKNKLESRVSGRDEFANTYQAATRVDAAANYTIAQMGWGVEIRDRQYGFQPLVWSKLNENLADCN